MYNENQNTIFHEGVDKHINHKNFLLISLSILIIAIFLLEYANKINSHILLISSLLLLIFGPMITYYFTQ